MPDARTMLAAIAAAIVLPFSPAPAHAADVPDFDRAFLDYLYANDCAATVGDLTDLHAQLVRDHKIRRPADARLVVLGFAASDVLEPGASFTIGDGPASITNVDFIRPEVAVRLTNTKGCP
ncbi:hypothetical protein [Paracoccus spongiarum]|uniref:Uncharacterized protein n=1 Tax=Paracoccus spongiarum TaxID=3064387 RepID=A0ABT9J7N4_9RHOB|nr:hypothetical protein [Paracoccus sp. 2205BS29-5]MDP5305801.1 hypothetical protein [Paracoccus sp. 2205BS29-5]